jgi:hypothetical protein
MLKGMPRLGKAEGGDGFEFARLVAVADHVLD